MRRCYFSRRRKNRCECKRRSKASQEGPAPLGAGDMAHRQPAADAPNARPQEPRRGRCRAGSKLRHSLKSLTPALLTSQPANVKRKPPENMFSCKIYKELCCGANSWKWRASSHSPRSDFSQHFGTSGSAPGGSPEARARIKHSLLPGQPGPGSFLEKGDQAREQGWTSCVCCFQEKGHRGRRAPCLAQVPGTRATRPGAEFLHRPGPDQIRSSNEQRGAHGK